MGEIPAALERAAHLVGGFLGPTAAQLGITQGEAHVLAQLDRRGPTSIAILHHEFGHKRSTLTNILDRLEARELVRRELNRSDRRSLIVHLTAPGRRTARRVGRRLDELEQELAAHVGEADVAGLDAVVAALEAIVRRGSPAEPPVGSTSRRARVPHRGPAARLTSRRPPAQA